MLVGFLQTSPESVLLVSHKAKIKLSAENEAIKINNEIVNLWKSKILHLSMNFGCGQSASIVTRL